MNSVEFAEILYNIRETQWKNQNEWIVPYSRVIGLFSAVLDRLDERCEGEENERLLRFRREFLNNVISVLRRVMEPVEPFAVMCHGDFNRNNMLFLYDENGLPTDMLPFDMATVRYGSPALDLSFFLYMNTDRRTRDVHWDELLNTYCAALVAALSDVTDVVRMPDRKQLDAEMHERGFYGLAHVSFFVRFMMEVNQSVHPIQFIGKTDEEILNLIMSFGGDSATDIIADAVQHFIDLRYSNIP